MSSERPFSGNCERHGPRWPKFFGFTFAPASLGPVGSGGVIDAVEESPAKALHLDLEFLADLFKLASSESALRAFWSGSHRSWVFYSPKPVQTLGKGPRSLCEFTLRVFKKKEKFYEEILAHYERLGS